METEKIKTAEEILNEHYINAYNNIKPGQSYPNHYPTYVLSAMEEYASQFKQKELLGDEKTKKTFVELISMAEDGDKLHKSNGVHQEFLNENKAILKQANELLLSLSNEAPKEQDKERETAIEFNEWLCEEGWIRRPFPEPNHEYLYDNHSVNNDDFNYKNGKTGAQLFDLFKQRNK